MCNAPGGKTAQLINNNLNVTSIESNSMRAKILNKNLKRLNLKTELVIKMLINISLKNWLMLFCLMLLVVLQEL